jgi:O-acetyl-ADP-ribose deacetylase (regulator of RNase III)
MSAAKSFVATINGRSLELALGDITQQEVDAIVNAANSQLAGGGGVDGAIHRRGGPSIMAETQERYPNGCPTGSAVITSAGNLPAKHVIHAVGPFWSGGGRDEKTLLASAYRTSLELAMQHNCVSIALPALSTGAYRYPIDEAARVAIEIAASFLKRLSAGQQPSIIRFVLFSPEVLSAFQQALEQTNSTA